MGNGSHPSHRRLEASEKQSIADETGKGQEEARKAQSVADALDMKKH